MSGLKFFYDLLNPGCRSIMLLLKAENLSFRGVCLNQKENEADIKNLNSLGTLPFIQDNNFKLSECSPILKYIFYKYKLSSHWYPQNDVQKQSKINEYMSWHHYNTFLNTQMYFEHKIHLLPVDFNALNKWKSLTEKTLDHLEYFWLPLLDNISNHTALEENSLNFENGYKYLHNKPSFLNDAASTKIPSQHQTREINLAHLLIACQLTQTYIAGWDVVTRDRPGIVHFYSNFKRRLAEIHRESQDILEEGRRAHLERVNELTYHRESNKSSTSTLQDDHLKVDSFNLEDEEEDLFYSVHREALNLRNIWYQQGKISIEL